MRKKNILFFSTALTVLFFTKNILAAQSQFSPYTDYLTIHLVGASPSDFGGVYYQPDSINQTNITGDNPFQSQNPTISISSNNKVAQGTPAITLFYTNGSRGTACTLIFVDGPWTVLNFNNGMPPAPMPFDCDGLTVSPITMTGSHQYQLTITKKAETKTDSSSEK